MIMEPESRFLEEARLPKVHFQVPPAVTKGCLMEDRGAHYPLIWGQKTTPL